MQEHTKTEDWDMVEAEIFSPLALTRRDPDNVPQSVVDNEMTLFATFTRQNKALEGGA